MGFNSKHFKKDHVDADFEVDFNTYQANKQFAIKTGQNLKTANVDHICIDIEEGPKPPLCCIAWVCSKIGSKGCIPISMNQISVCFKEKFINAGEIILNKINYAKEQAHKTPKQTPVKSDMWNRFDA